MQAISFIHEQIDKYIIKTVHHIDKLRIYKATFCHISDHKHIS